MAVRRKVFACSHDGVYLVGYSIVVAHSEAEAREMLEARLQELNLDAENYDLDEIKGYGVTVLFDGDY